jgi:hypothetical protein
MVVVYPCTIAEGHNPAILTFIFLKNKSTYFYLLSYKCDFNKNQLYKLMLAIGDEEIEALLGDGALKAPNINCASGHKVERLCCNGYCTLEATCCNDIDCKHCEGCHSTCPFISIKKLIKHSEANLFFVRKAVSDILRVEDDILNQLKASRKLMVKKIKERIADDVHSSAVDSFFANGDPISLKGK